MIYSSVSDRGSWKKTKLKRYRNTLHMNNYTYYVLLASAMTIRSHFTKNIWYVQSVMVCCPLLQKDIASSLTRPCPNFITCHHENMSVYCITPLLYSKTWVCRGIPIFLIFAPKHRLWVLIRTAAPRRF